MVDVDDVTPTPEDSPLRVDWFDTDEQHVRVNVGACRLRIQPGGPDRLLAGEYDDPTGTLPLTVSHEHGSLRIAQQTRLSDVRGFKAAVPTLDLSVGTGRPVSLHLATGASDVHAELGGLALRRVSVRLGAGSATIGFAAPVPVGFERFECEAGAASVTISGLGNADPEAVAIVGGAASYDLSFDGRPGRDMHAKVTTAGAAVVLRVPTDVAARIGVVSVLAGLTVRDGFQTWEDSYWTQPGVDGRHPLLSVDTSVTLGSLEIVGHDDVEPPGIEPGSR